VRHNIANAMAAAAMADALGVVSEIVGAGLASFETSVEQSPGRFNVISDHPFLVIVDRAMSPPAAEALVEALRGINVEGRRICMFTSVGNRPRRHFRELVTVLARDFDHYVCYERKQYRRGRAPGEIGELLRSELLRSGVEAHSIDVALDCEGALSMLSMRPKRGDLVVALGSFRGEDIPTLRAAFPSSCAS
jgi:cyanophycin synthetase